MSSIEGKPPISRPAAQPRAPASPAETELQKIESLVKQQGIARNGSVSPHERKAHLVRAQDEEVALPPIQQLVKCVREARNKKGAQIALPAYPQAPTPLEITKLYKSLKKMAPQARLEFMATWNGHGITSEGALLAQLKAEGNKSLLSKDGDKIALDFDLAQALYNQKPITGRSLIPHLTSYLNSMDLTKTASFLKNLNINAKSPLCQAFSPQAQLAFCAVKGDGFPSSDRVDALTDKEKEVVKKTLSSLSIKERLQCMKTWQRPERIDHNRSVFSFLPDHMKTEYSITHGYPLARILREAHEWQKPTMQNINNCLKEMDPKERTAYLQQKQNCGFKSNLDYLKLDLQFRDEIEKMVKQDRSQLEFLLPKLKANENYEPADIDKDLFTIAKALQNPKNTTTLDENQVARLEAILTTFDPASKRQFFQSWNISMASPLFCNLEIATRFDYGLASDEKFVNKKLGSVEKTAKTNQEKISFYARLSTFPNKAIINYFIEYLDLDKTAATLLAKSNFINSHDNLKNLLSISIITWKLNNKVTLTDMLAPLNLRDQRKLIHKLALVFRYMSPEEQNEQMRNNVQFTNHELFREVELGLRNKFLNISING